MSVLATRWLSFSSELDPLADCSASPTRRRVPAIAPIVAITALAVVLVEVGRWTWHRRQLDFAVYVLGAHHITDSQLYNVGLATSPHLPFTYPPFAALVFWPLSLLPLQVAALVWAGVNVAALWSIIALSLQIVGSRWDRTDRLTGSLLLLVPALALEPVSLTFSFGQINLVLAALVLADLSGHLSIVGRTVPRGVMVGLSAAVKLVPLIFIPYLFLTRQRRAALVAAATFVGSSLVAAAFDPGVSWSYWSKYVVDAQRVGGASYISNQSLRGSLDRLTHHVVSAHVVNLLAAGVVVAGLALAAWAARSSSPFLGILVCAATGLLASPITWAHHMVWIVPLLLWLIWSPDRPRGGFVWAAFAAALFWWAPIWSVPNAVPRVLQEHGWQLVRGNSFFGATALFLVATAIMLALRQLRARHSRRDVIEA